MIALPACVMGCCTMLCSHLRQQQERATAFLYLCSMESRSECTNLRCVIAGLVQANCPQRIAKVHDQYLSFTALEARLFSLGLPDTYLQLNDPKAQDTQIQVWPHSHCICVYPHHDLHAALFCQMSAQATHLPREVLRMMEA